MTNNRVNNIMNKTSWTITVEEAEDGSGDLVLPLPDDLMTQAGWQEGDTLEWKEESGGAWSLKKATNG
jgi:hypothetical protein